MKALVTSKGQITIPKALRDQVGIHPGAHVDLEVVEDAIRLRKVKDSARKRTALGCLKTDLKGRSVAQLMEELRGPVEMPRSTPTLSGSTQMTSSMLIATLLGLRMARFLKSVCSS